MDIYTGIVMWASSQFIWAGVDINHSEHPYWSVAKHAPALIAAFIIIFPFIAFEWVKERANKHPENK